MDNSKKFDVMSLFRLSATSMSAAILLILASISPQVAVMGFIFAIFAFVVLIAAFTQIFPQVHKFYETIAKFNDELTILFILISLVSIIRNWVTIIKAINGITDNVVPKQVLWVQSAISTSILIWLYSFVLFFCVVVLFDVTKSAIKIFGKLGVKQALFRLLASIFYVLGCWGVAHYMFIFDVSTFNLILFVLSILLTLSMFVYLALHKSKMSTENNEVASNVNPSEQKNSIK